MLSTIALVVLLAVLTVALGTAFRTPLPTVAVRRPVTFRDPLHRPATLPRPVLASPTLHRAGNLCAACGSLVPVRQDRCVVCAVDRAFEYLTSGGHDAGDRVLASLAAAPVPRHAEWIAPGAR